MEPFTVVIPTLDRGETIAHTLESCIAQDDDNFSIIVSDNHSTDATREVVSHYEGRDKRIRYVRPPHRLGQSKNWEYALDKVESGYAMVLGSDDALLPSCMTLARDCVRQYPGMKVLSGVTGALYYYPDSGGTDAGELRLLMSHACEVRRSKPYLERIVRGECLITELPFAYTCGWMDVSLLQQVKRIAGRSVPCRTTPVYLALACVALTDEYLHVGPGFGCSGVSAKSIGYSLQHSHGDRERDKVFLEESNIEERDVPYHPLVGDTRSEHMHVAESILTAREVGVLPPEPPIAWDRLIAMAYRDYRSGDWSDADQKDNLDALRAVGRRVGCTEIMDLADRYPDPAEWRKHLPFQMYQPMIHGASVTINTLPLKLQGVHEAARLADTLFQAARETSNVQVSANGFTGDQILRCLADSLRELGSLRERFNAALETSNRRAAERERAKAKVAEMRTKLDKLRDRGKSSTGSSSPLAWLRRLIRN